MSDRFKDTAQEIVGITDEQVEKDQLNNYLLRMIMVRMSNKKYDDQCVARLKGLNPDQVKAELLKDIRNGQAFKKNLTKVCTCSEE